jgi:hypothetical protein
MGRLDGVGDASGAHSGAHPSEPNRDPGRWIELALDNVASRTRAETRIGTAGGRRRYLDRAAHDDSEQLPMCGPLLSPNPAASLKPLAVLRVRCGSARGLPRRLGSCSHGGCWTQQSWESGVSVSLKGGAAPGVAFPNDVPSPQTDGTGQVCGRAAAPLYAHVGNIDVVRDPGPHSDTHERSHVRGWREMCLENVVTGSERELIRRIGHDRLLRLDARGDTTTDVPGPVVLQVTTPSSTVTVPAAY